MDELNKVLAEITTRIYQSVGPQYGGGSQQNNQTGGTSGSDNQSNKGNSGDDKTVDAEYKVVDDEK